MIDREEDMKKDENEWKFAATVIDRLGLVIYVIFICTTTIGFYLMAPFIIN
jgi:hypothetical protein